MRLALRCTRFVSTLCTLCAICGWLFVSPLAQSASDRSRTAFASEHAALRVARVYLPDEMPYAIHRSGAPRPSNILLPQGLESLFESMLQRSATFRRQCHRIAAAPLLTVVVQRDLSPARSAIRAQTHVLSEPGGRRYATVHLNPLTDEVQYIAHEFEHIIEQLDGIDLREKSRLASSGVEFCDCNEAAFETTRAIRMGLRVAQEFRHAGR